MDAPAGTSIGDVSQAELRLAARNHGMPLEALRHPVTPVGLHYLLIHYDIPAVDPGDVAARGRRRRASGRVIALAGGPAGAAGRDAHGHAGVRRQRPGAARAAPGEPAVADRGDRHGRVDRRRRCAPCSSRPGWRDDAVELLFTGLDRGFEGGVEQDYERSLPVAEALGDDALLAYELNGAPLPPQHGFPLRLVIAGLVRDGARQVARRDHRADRAVRGLPAGGRLPALRRRRRRRRAGHADAPALAHGARPASPTS